jgi:hypothetical protein
MHEQIPPFSLLLFFGKRGGDVGVKHFSFVSHTRWADHVICKVDLEFSLCGYQ